MTAPSFPSFYFVILASGQRGFIFEKTYKDRFPMHVMLRGPNDLARPRGVSTWAQILRRGLRMTTCNWREAGGRECGALYFLACGFPE